MVKMSYGHELKEKILYKSDGCVYVIYECTEGHRTYRLFVGELPTCEGVDEA